MTPTTNMRDLIDLIEHSAQEIEDLYGDIAKLPTHDEYDEDLTPEEIAKLDQEDPERDRGPYCLTGYGHAWSCDNWATMIEDKLGDRARVFGFWCHDNPTELDSHCEGHTFAVVDDHLIVDGWIKNVAGLTTKTVFDLNDPADAETIRRFYGDRSKWVERIDGNWPEGHM